MPPTPAHRAVPDPAARAPAPVDRVDRVDAIGVDGCPGGWVAALVRGRAVRWELFGTFAAVLAAAGAAPVGIDMPVGLATAGRRGADVAARARLGAARSSIFWAPTRAEVARWRVEPRHPRGAGISLQTWNIVPKIAEVDDLMTPPLQRQVVEVHPESSFRALAPGATFASKRTAAGARERMAALRGHYDVPDLPDAPRGVTGDALDALAAAWSAARWRAGTAVLLPDPAPRDARGLRMQVAV